MFGRNYNLMWMLLWLGVLLFLLLRDLILPARLGGRVGGLQAWLATLLALALAVYNFARWWARRTAYDPTRGVRVNPLAEARPAPDEPRSPVVHHPEFDFTKPDPETTDKPANP